jgi:hypothetical protein
VTPRSAVLPILFALLAPARHALAFSELSRFSDAVSEGGGAGRWYTGSPADGYNCAVCHADGKAVSVMVSGLPDRYQLGATYEVLMTWPVAVERISALAEFTDEHGQGAGTVHVPSDAAMDLLEPDICQPVGLKVPAVQRFAAPDFDVSNNRQVVGLTDCGGSQMRLQWTAPAQDAGTVFFSGGVVQSNHMSDLLGDGVVEIFRPVLPPAGKAYAVETSGGCGAGQNLRALKLSELVLWCACVLGFSYRHRRRFASAHQ